MPGRILPCSAAETAAAAEWLPYLASVREAACADPGASVEALDNATAEEVDKLERRGCITCTVAALLLEIFDVPDTCLYISGSIKPQAERELLPSLP